MTDPSSNSARRRILIIGIGAGGNDFVTLAAARAMQSVDVFVVAEKGPDDPLVAARRHLLEHVGADHIPVVTVADPDRDRSHSGTAAPDDYRRAVTDWHEARAARFAEAFSTTAGDVGLLVWGDPAYYDSTIRIVERIAAAELLPDFEVEVIPGVSAISVLAARHRIVLHDIGRSVHVTTGRMLHSAVVEGQDNIVVMLDGALRCADLLTAGSVGPWQIWWGANLGTESQELAAGPLTTTIGDIRRRRERARTTAGWVMDTYLLRRMPSTDHC